ncbi:MAG TPA: TonB-dependent receptor [Tenuifilaceae bacterium]|nr:TonB-dependent receptor [Tenuifilaceae bacterium]HPN20936.1 TonB-dependent receptor [Tenuifilaceae bacterium]
MSKKFFFAALGAALLSFNAFGQNVVFQGTVVDSETNQTLENATISATSEGGAYNTLTNLKGQFSVSLPKGNYNLTIRVLGYSSISKDINITDNSNQTFALQQQPIAIGEIVVSSMRVNRKIKELPTPLAVVESQSIQKQSAITLSNVLANEPGIAMGSDGVWATNINIRGLSENRLVTLIDGNRVETATDLTASLSMVDVNDIDRIEVVKGAQSSLYGTGAMGGIVNIFTKDGYFGDKFHLSGNVISGFASANSNFNEHIDINAGSKSWFARVGGTFNTADDIRTPDGILPNSQFTTNNFSAKVGVKPFSNNTLKVQYQRNGSTDVGIPGGSAFPGPATATYSNIYRQLIAANYEITDISDKLQSLKFSYFNQFIKRDVEMYPNTVINTTLPNGNTQRQTPTLFVPIGKHQTHGAQIQSNWSLSDKNTLIVGIDSWARWLNTERTKYVTVEVFNPSGTLLATNYLVRGETPIPSSMFASAGLFVQDEAKLMDDKLTIILGGRIDGVYVKNDSVYDVDYIITNGTINNTPATQRLVFEEGTENGISWSANAGAIYRLVDDIDLSANFSRSFRAPSLEERFKYIDLGNSVRLGDPELKPESGYSADFGLKIWKPKFNLQVGAFTNWLSNMIVETPGEFTYTLASGVTNTVPALINANVSKAFLYGIDFGFQYNFHKGFVVFGSGAYVRGEDTNTDTNLPQIPPMNGRLGLRYNYPKLGAIEFTAVGANKQDKVAAGEDETGGYVRYDMSINSSKINLGFAKMQLFAGVDNITDRKYTNHLATNRGSISVEPGRNIFVRLNIAF